MFRVDNKGKREEKEKKKENRIRCKQEIGQQYIAVYQPVDER